MALTSSGGDEIGFDIFGLDIVIDVRSLVNIEIGFDGSVIVRTIWTGVDVEMAVPIGPFGIGSPSHYIVK